MGVATDPLPLARTWQSVTSGAAVLTVAGAVASVAGWQSWAWLVVAGLGIGAVGQIVIGVIAFRRTMKRKWPDVAPLSDDDWDD